LPGLRRQAREGEAVSWLKGGKENCRSNHGEVTSVICRSVRDETGIDYAVAIEIEGDETDVWSMRVAFGSTDATVAAGYAFAEAARAQHRAALEAWALNHETAKRAKEKP
jgi:CO/xanthine dehydrogenase FAD-binding subunit